MRLGRPLKWTEDRQENFLGTTQERGQLHDAEIALTREGRILGIDYPAMREDLLGRLRAAMSQNAQLAAALRELERAVASHYLAEAPCC